MLMAPMNGTPVCAGIRLSGNAPRKFTENLEPGWFQKYGDVVLSGRPARFEECNAPLDRWFEVHAFPLQAKKRIGITFSEISQQKQDLARLEYELRQSQAELSRAVATLHEEVLQRMEAERVLRDHSEQLRSLASQLTLAEQRERMRLSQVLHDGLQQILVGAKYQLSFIGKKSSFQQDIAGLAEILDSAIETSRSLTAELGPPVLCEGGLVSSLEWLVSGCMKNTV